MQFSSIVIASAIRRDILSALATFDASTLAAATAQIADGWSGRRRRLGHSPSSVRAVAALVHLVGAELAHAQELPNTRGER